MTRTLYKNIALLDARNVTPEMAQGIYGIKNVAMLLLTPASQRALAGVPQTDIASVCTLPEGIRLSQINGQCTLSGGCEEPVALIVNGQMQVESAMTPEQIRKSVKGGLVNGQIIASEEQIQALYACGLQLNGQASTYPNGFEMRSGKEPITRAEVNAWKEGVRIFVQKRVRVEEGALAAIKARAARIGGRLIVDESEAALLEDVYEGESGQCMFVPHGARVAERELRVNRRNALTVRGEICALRDVIIDAQVSAQMLAGLKSLTVRGRLIVPAGLVETLVERVNADAEWIPYEGELIYNDTDMCLDAHTLSGVEGATIYNEGTITLDEALDAHAIRQALCLIYNEGTIQGTKEQLAALRRMLGDGNGDMTENGNKKEEQEREALPEDVVVIGDMTALTLG